jgi:hypothetical protein
MMLLEVIQQKPVDLIKRQVPSNFPFFSKKPIQLFLPSITPTIFALNLTLVAYYSHSLHQRTLKLSSKFSDFVTLHCNRRKQQVETFDPQKMARYSPNGV